LTGLHKDIGAGPCLRERHRQHRAAGFQSGQKTMNNFVTSRRRAALLGAAAGVMALRFGGTQAAHATSGGVGW